MKKNKDKVINEEGRTIKDIVYPSLFKRFISDLLDIVFIVLIALPFYLPVLDGYYDYGFNISENLTAIKKIQVDSHLLFDDSSEDEAPYTTVNYLNSKKISDENGYLTYDESYVIILERIYYFYYVYLANINGYMSVFNEETDNTKLNNFFYEKVLNIDNSEYPENKFSAFYIINGDKNSDPLTINSENELLNINVGVLDTVIFNGVSYTKNLDESYNSEANQAYIKAALNILVDTDYYPGSYHQACLYLKELDEYLDIYKYLERVGKYVLYIALAISLSLNLIIIPLLSKNGLTLSGRIFKIGLVNKEGYQVSKLQIFIKYLFNSLEAYLGLFTMFLWYLVEFFLIIFTKKHQSIGDFIAATLVIDTKNSVWFYNREVEEDIMNKIDKRFENNEENM